MEKNQRKIHTSPALLSSWCSVVTLKVLVFDCLYRRLVYSEGTPNVIYPLVVKRGNGKSPNSTEFCRGKSFTTFTGGIQVPHAEKAPLVLQTFAAFLFGNHLMAAQRMSWNWFLWICGCNFTVEKCWKHHCFPIKVYCHWNTEQLTRIQCQSVP